MDPRILGEHHVEAAILINQRRFGLHQIEFDAALLPSRDDALAGDVQQMRRNVDRGHMASTQ